MVCVRTVLSHANHCIRRTYLYITPVIQGPLGYPVQFSSCELVDFIDKANWGTQCSPLLVLVIAYSTQCALLACLCVVAVPRGTLGYS